MAILAAEFTHARSSGWSLPAALYGVFAVFCILALHPTVFAMAQTWVSSSSYHHGVAVIPLALLMILSRPRIAPATGPLSLLAVCAAAMAWLAGRAAGVLLIEEIAFVSLLIAGAGVIFGAAALRVWALPLLFLYFMVPFGDALVPILQQATARAVVVMLNFFGVAATIDGVFIKTSAGLFEIARACAGLNFLLAALMIAWVYASQVLHSQRIRAAFVAIAAIVALIANYVRAFLLILIATLSDMRFAVGPDHLAIGIVFYGAVFFLLLWIGARMNKPRGVGPEHAPVSARRPWRPSIAIIAFIPVIAVSIYGAQIIDRPSEATVPLQLSALNAPGWRMLSAPQNWTPHVDADQSKTATYDRSGERVYVSVSYFSHDRRGREIVNSENRAADGVDWRFLQSRREVVYLFGESEEVTLDILAGDRGRRLLTATIYWRGDETYTDRVKFKWAQMLDKLNGRNPPGGLIIIASDYAGDPAAALKRIRAFTTEVESFAEWRARNRAGV